MYVSPDAEVAKISEENETTPNLRENQNEPENKPDKEVENTDDCEVSAPPSTSTRKDQEEEPVEDGKESAKTYSRFPKFKVTWDSKIPSLMSNKNPKKKSRNSVITERYGVPMYVFNFGFLSRPRVLHNRLNWERYFGVSFLYVRYIKGYRLQISN